MQTLKLKIKGINCESCANLIEDSLKHLKGVREARVSYSTKKATIVYDELELDADDIINTIEHISDYKVENLEEKPASATKILKFVSKNQIPTGVLIGISIVIASLIISGTIVFINKSRLSTYKQEQPVLFPQQSPIDNRATTDDLVNIPLRDNDHIRGNKEAGITIIEFVDIQCPFCARAHPTMKQIMKDYAGKVRWVYKHFPLEAIHPEAIPAALASECIWEQKGDDGFWQFVDSAFENRENLGIQLYKDLAKKIGVDMNKFEKCISERKYESKIREDYQQGINVGVNGTPTFFINGKRLNGAQPYDSFKTIIDKLLGKS